MDTKLLLVKLITLIYLESKLDERSNGSTELITSILTHIKLPESYATNEFGKDPLISLRETARWMNANPQDHHYDKHELLQQLRVNCGNDNGLYDSLVSGIAPDFEPEALKEIVISYKHVLRQYINQSKVKELLKEAYTKTWFQSSTIDWRHYIKELTEALTPYSNNDCIEAAHPSVVSDVMFGDTAAVKNVFQRGVNELDTRGIIQFGWQGLNRMFGASMGARRGEMIVVGALQHNFKSGTTLEMFKSAALYNIPMLRDPTKKPLLMRISFENPIELDMTYLYRSLVENETGVYTDPKMIDIDEATRYVTDRLQATGFHINMCHIDPSEFTFRDLFDRVERFEAQGYEVIMLNIDYLPMMSKRGCATGPAGVEFRDLYRRVRNFTSKKGIICITPHQLSTEAKQLTRVGVDNFVQEIANRGYWDSCKTIDQEVDLEIYQHIVKVNGESYLTFQRGKHRKATITPERDLYFVYKFQQVGTIPDDILGVDCSRRSVGGKTVSDGGEGAWWSSV